MQIIFHGHSFVEILGAQGSILIDPFITDNPRCDITIEQLADKNITHILLTHGHRDHVGDTIALAQTHSTCKVVAMVELCDWLEKKGVAS